MPIAASITNGRLTFIISNEYLFYFLNIYIYIYIYIYIEMIHNVVVLIINILPTSKVPGFLTSQQRRDKLCQMLLNGGIIGLC